ncbi:MAG: valyl-tRNA synthetase, partial [Chloroflexota bacterium]|nr:valyl-tRNA synthetase [Chloroflexota bacterium]
MPDLPKAYTPHEVEGAIYDRWLAADVFAPDGKGSTADPTLPPFTIIQPPPNITGSLHLGHAQRTAVEDLMIRHARMRGHRALFLPGLDHASIAAQFVLDGILAREGEDRQSLGRERYLERMRAFVATTREVMLVQQRRVGASADWGRLRYTMDDRSAKAVRAAFERLYRADLAYRTEALVNWCPGCRTSVSDLEVIATPETGTLWSVRYHLVDSATGRPEPDAGIVVATTRPETILGDTAVAVHPDDPRYAALVGRLVRVPFVERDVPVIADPVVDPAFGTGAVKITPAHDPQDYATGLRHGLAAPTILGDDASVTGTGTRFDGMDRYEARAAMVAEIETRGDLVAAIPHDMVIGRCQRSNDVIEPRLKTQWFIRTTPLAERALEATRAGRTRILPERFEKTWEHWLTNIRDWNVSRQLWWGHRIPAWYCPDGHVTVSSAETGPDGCEVCGRPAAALTQDSDIFDTWFSSGLWPFSTLGWPDDTDDYRAYYPTSVMETGYDIIFFWVARMMMLGLELTGREPFHTVYLSGLIRDPAGQKMSKTKGNVVDPLGVIHESGADALRFAVIHGATPGNDQRFGPVKLEHARNFANKLWNATRYVVGARPATIPEGAERRLPDERHLGPAERWLHSRAAATTAAVDEAMSGFAFGEVTRLVYEAIWDEYCDWGLEFAKVRLTDPGTSADEREATWWTLVEVLDTYLRLLHPIMPFVTEALWGGLPHRPGDPELLIVARWPGMGERDAAAESEVGALIELVGEIRNARASAKLPAGDWL